MATAKGVIKYQLKRRVLPAVGIALCVLLALVVALPVVGTILYSVTGEYDVYGVVSSTPNCRSTESYVLDDMMITRSDGRVNSLRIYAVSPEICSVLVGDTLLLRLSDRDPQALSLKRDSLVSLVINDKIVYER